MIATTKILKKSFAVIKQKFESYFKLESFKPNSALPSELVVAGLAVL